MKHALTLAAASFLFTTPVLAQSAALTVSTGEFVRRVAVSDLFEIYSSQTVAQEADADTKPFAEQMIRDHQKTSSELKALVQSGKVTADIPTLLDEPHKKKLDEIRSKLGAERDQAYDRAQVEAHREAVALFESYAQSGDNPDLKQWAAATLPQLRHHLQMAEQLK